MAIAVYANQLTQTMTGDCIRGVWTLKTASGKTLESTDFENGGIWRVSDNHPLGIQTWTPAGASGWNGPVPQNTLKVDIRLGTGAWISSSRKGAVVTLTGTALLYSQGDHKWFKRSAAGVFQYRDRGTTAWKPLKAVRTSSAGTVTMAYTYAPTRDYRFALYSTPISWDVASAVTTR
ncbi:hypothetical protein [Kribbella caucasensis]|uniref:hypothetical protein n=1 Tax=Kribbella caucasensis TaxID=2512215 RepID=UPI001061ADEB|nr:hypothetical protein [Kribbella sp. VKM Ac-2527]